MIPAVRVATDRDIAAIMQVRYAVHENRLTSGVISDADVHREIFDSGRGWVIEVEGQVRAFAIGNARSGNIWALFVHPDFEGRGFGRRLHDEMVNWLWARGLARLVLSTDPGTRAERFYRARGWRDTGLAANGEIGFELLPEPGAP